MVDEGRNRSNFTKVFFQAVVIGVVSSVIGLGFNTVNPNGIPLDHTKITKQQESNGEEVSCEPIPFYIEDVDELRTSDSTIFIDSRQVR